MTAKKAAPLSAGHLFNQDDPGIGPGHLRNSMQDQSMSRAISARAPHAYSNLHPTAAPRQPTGWRKPSSPGLTQAQLQRIVLEKLG